MPIVDRRQESGGKDSPQRQKFLERFKKTIKKRVKEDAVERSIKDFKGNVKVRVPEDTLQEPELYHDTDTGPSDRIHVGNKSLPKGTRIPRPPSGQGSGRKAGQGEGEDDFVFELSEEEWRGLLFEDMELPDFIKESINKEVSFEWRREGFIKDGVPSRLDVEKSYIQSFARRLALEDAGVPEEDIPFIEDIDLRYRHYEKHPKPITHAVMVCVMDVSGSMGQEEKYLAKMFFVLLHLFLTGNYKNVDVIFVRHTDEAKECDEEEFFYSKESGGTLIMPALSLVNDIITKRYDTSKTNVYVAQASDGDAMDDDAARCVRYIQNKLLDKIQYYAYIELSPEVGGYSGWSRTRTTLKDYYQKIATQFEKFQIGYIKQASDVFPVLQQLFTRKKK